MDTRQGDLTVPNLITTIRIILAPIFIIYLLNRQVTSALIVFVVCSASDGVDGLLARFLNQKSRLGTFLDPLADKLLLISAYVALSVTGFLPAWLTVAVIARDVMILLGVLVIALNGMDFRIQPSVISKINTCLQFITVILVLSRECWVFPPTIYLAAYYLTAIFTVASGLHYMQFWFRVMGEGTGNHRE